MSEQRIIRNDDLRVCHCTLAEYRMYVAQSLFLIDVGLLPYTELTKYHVQDVFDIHKSRDLPYRLGSIT
jgi:hypothetical protein